MKKTVVFIAFFLSCHNFVAAQRNVECQIKMGIYSDFFKYPTIDPALIWIPIKYKVWCTIGLGIHIKKWRTLAQLNFETKITLKQNDFVWQGGLGYVVERIERNYIPKEGDYKSASYYYFNPINVLYQLNKSDERFKVYAGLGLTGRYDRVSTLLFLDGEVWDVLGGYRRLRFMPSLKTELQYNLGKHFFLSAHASYAYFGKEPNHYLQVAFNTGLRF